MFQRSTCYRAVLTIVILSAGMALADDSPSADPQTRAYQSASEGAEQRFRDTLNSAMKIRAEKLKQANEVFVAAIAPAANTLQEVRKKAIAAALAQYDSRIKDVTQKGNLDGAIKVKEEKERFLTLAKADDDRLNAEIQPLIGGDMSAIPEIKADEIIQLKQVKQQVMSTAVFFEKYSAAFPSAANLAHGGSAQATSTAQEDPVTIFGGVRYHDTWFLKGGKGSILAGWAKPPVGQYLLFFSRATDARFDNWGKAHIEINGQGPITVEKMAGTQVLVMDLGHPTAIRSVKVDFDGTDNPGFGGLEIHREMKKK